MYKKIKKYIGSIMRAAGLRQGKRGFLFGIVPKGGACAEICVGKGDFSEEILRNGKPSRLFLIDPWKFQDEFPERMFGGKVAKSQEDMDAIFDAVKHRLRKYKQTKYIREFSDTAASALSDDSLDWIYIDGNHYKDFVLKDLELYTPKVKVGGYICGDDYDWRPHPEGECEVKQAVTQFLETNSSVKLVLVKNSQFVLQRTK